MILKTLGTGAALPSKKRSGPAHLIKIKDDLVLMDCGYGTLSQFMKIPEDYFDLNYILITHTHADHLTDLMALIQAIFVRTLKIGGEEKRIEPLVIIGPPGFKKAFYELKKILQPEKVGFEIQVYEMGDSRKNFKHWTLESAITRHVEFWKSVSYKITEENEAFVYSGDTGFCPEIINFTKDAKTLMLECTVSASWEFPKGHLNPQFVAEIAELSGAKTLILTHLYDIDSPTEIKKEISKKFKGKIIIAKDLEKIVI
jgi:ribonuclease BN (tRNA processing enzyme)